MSRLGEIDSIRWYDLKKSSVKLLDLGGVSVLLSSQLGFIMPVCAPSSSVARFKLTEIDLNC